MKSSSINSTLLVTLPLVSCMNLKSSPAVASEHKNGGRTPNIIFILADDIGYECIGAYGGTYRTPNLDALAKSGMLFENCHSQPLSTPTRVQVMTGKYNHKNYVEFGYINPDEKTFAHLAKKAGYRTSIAGKWQLGLEESLPSQLGFDDYCLWQFTEKSISEQRYANACVEVNGKLHPSSADIDTYGPDIHQEHVLEYISRHKDDRFFIYYPTPLVHSPFQPTPLSESWKHEEKRLVQTLSGFSDMVEYLDRQVGEIIDRLKKEGIYENTVIVFAGDNGTNRKIVSAMKDGTVVRGGKGRTTDNGTHVPLIVSYPGVVRPGTIEPRLVDMTDMMPTFADLMGVEVPVDWDTDGISFYPELTGEKGPDRKWIFCHYAPLNKGKASRNDTRFVRTEHFKLYYDGRFFNTEEDPMEQTPVVPCSETEKQAFGMLDSVLKSFPSWKPGDLPEVRKTGDYKAASVEPKPKK